MLAINMGQSKNEVLRFLENFDLEFQIALDSDSSVSRSSHGDGLIHEVLHRPKWSN